MRRPPVLPAIEVISVVYVVAGLFISERDAGPLGLLFDLVFTGLLLWLVVKVTRRGSAGARIALTAIFVAWLGLYLWTLVDLGFLWPITNLLYLFEGIGGLGTLVAVILLFVQQGLLWSRPTSRWVVSHY